MAINSVSKINYVEKECKSVLNKSGIADYAVNCYTGCAHGCVYCYARFTSRFTHPYEVWGTYVDVKINAPEVLAKEIRRKAPGRVMLSSVCDAWQPAEPRYGLTRQCLEMLVRNKLEVSTLTKNQLASRDLDILAGAENIDFGVTITSLDKQLCRIIEPMASSPEKRLELLEKAKEKGLTTYAFVGPLLPFLSDSAESIKNVLKAIKEVGVDYFYVDKTNLRYGVWPALLKMLRERYPNLLEKYREIFFQPAANARYVEGIYKNARESAAKLGIADKLTIC
ncbi:MAG TPA: radical SAM protein [Dehalococcoidales bacterium]|nr:radical SAM protein [Dehalococcoidales bacterium]